MREREAAMTPEERAAGDASLVEGFLGLPSYRKARTVLLYCGAGAEVDTRPILENALAQGKLTALPKITGPGTMEARRISSLSRLVPGPYGILEPDGVCPAVPPEEFDLILVPGMAFTQDGRRLGRGGGFYDRYLPQTRAALAALVRRFQLIGSIPTGSHDVSVDWLVLDSGEDGP